MPFFRKKPVLVEAVLFTGSNHEVIHAWFRSFTDDFTKYPWRDGQDRLIIPTLEGQHVASPGDMIIRGVAGEFYPCKPDIFDKTYEECDR